MSLLAIKPPAISLTFIFMLTLGQIILRKGLKCLLGLVPHKDITPKGKGPPQGLEKGKTSKKRSLWGDVIDSTSSELYTLTKEIYFLYNYERGKKIYASYIHDNLPIPYAKPHT